VTGVSVKTEALAAGGTVEPFLMGTGGTYPTFSPTNFDASNQFASWLDFEGQIQMDEGAAQQATFDTSMYPFDFTSMYSGAGFPSGA
jgi:hypothetical protein